MLYLFLYTFFSISFTKNTIEKKQETCVKIIAKVYIQTIKTGELGNRRHFWPSSVLRLFCIIFKKWIMLLPQYYDTKYPVFSFLNIVWGFFRIEDIQDFFFFWHSRCKALDFFLTLPRVITVLFFQFIMSTTSLAGANIVPDVQWWPIELKAFSSQNYNCLTAHAMLLTWYNTINCGPYREIVCFSL